jgi:hypothetical protein
VAAHKRQWCIVAMVVDGGLGEAFGLVLHNEDYMKKVSQHRKQEGGS